MGRVFVDAGNLELAHGVRQAVEADGHEAALVTSPRDVEGRLGGADDAALVLTTPPGERAGTALRRVFDAEIPRPPVIAVSDAADADARRQLARKFELDEVIGIPLDPEEVRVVLEAQLDRYELQRETGIVGRTDPIREVLERIHMIAPVGATVLLTGESGTGKELVARAIHRLSPRRAKPFIPVNCAALPESLLESELFGHEKGAFTGATSLRRGMFELADGGTLFLDELAEMPLPTQTRLLRVLESRRFMRVGGDREIEVSVRVVAATNRELRAAVEVGEFRRDLYYRLNVLNIELPPLRERRDDIPVLVRRFISEFSRTHDRTFRGLTPEAMHILLDYEWPGNVRELRNLIESMVVLAPGAVIRPEDIPLEIRSRRGERLLPTRARPARSHLPVPSGEGLASPQLELVFRTLVELKVDMEDLKREFEVYKSRARDEDDAELPPGLAIEIGSSREPRRVDPGPDLAAWTIDLDAEAEDGQEDAGSRIEFRPGMSMAELEREAIAATLRDVGGNRRKAAEKLQIGERTLYRKIKQYEIEL